MVQPTISSQGSNSSIQVSWNKPSGNVEYYAVFLELQSLPQQQSQNITMGTTVKFDGLSAGRIYSARVVTHSGPRSSPSTYVSNATCESQTFFVFAKIFNQSIRIFYGTFSERSHATPEYSCCPFFSDAFIVPFMLP